MNFSVDLSGKVAIVTGAGEGIGRAIALALARSGATLCVNDINPDRAETIAEDIRSAGGTAMAWAADVSNKFQMAAMIEQVRERYTHLNILVNAAGVQKSETFLKLDEYDWRRTLEVNLTGTFFCTQLCGRVMADEGGGVIITFASSFGYPLPPEKNAAYVASKSGIIGFTREIARELAPFNVRVNAICPGEIQETTYTPIMPTNPQGRIGTPEDVAAVALFLCSDGASFITGQAIHVDGGLSVP